MNFLNINLKKILLLIFFISLPLISINMEQKKSEDTWFAQPLSFIAQFFQNAFSGLSLGVKGTTAEYLNLIRIKKDNLLLKNEVQELQTRLQVLNEQQIEIERLKSFMDFQKNTRMTLTPAQVIGRDLLPDHKTITINKGTIHGIKHMQAVLTVAGAVGYVFRPEKTTSHIMLITDRYSVVDALLQKTRAHGILEGLGKDTNGGVLQYIDRNEDVKPGDIIVTGGIDNIFPKGFPLGVVTEVEKKAINPSLIIKIKPIIESNKIEEVFVVLNAKNEDFLKGQPIETVSGTETVSAGVKKQ